MGKKLCVVLVGAPCSGKSTIGKATVDNLGHGRARYISSGDIARDMATTNAHVQRDLMSGRLAPEEEMRQRILFEINKSVIGTNRRVVILDGFPRFGEQAEWLERAIGDLFNIEYVLIETPNNILRKRAKERGRYDDKSFNKRLQYYNEVTHPELLTRIRKRIYVGHASNDTYVQILLRIIRESKGGIKDAKYRQV